MNTLAPLAAGLVEPLELERLTSVKRRTGKSRSAIYRDIAAGKFPAPVKISERSSAWVRSEVSDWIAARVAKRDIGGAA